MLHRAGFLPATDGNLSIRLTANRILITKSQIEKSNLTRDDLLELDLSDDNPRGASSEWPMHQTLYAKRSDINCILHVHSPYLTAFACAHRIPSASLLAESAMEKSPIILVPYWKPGSVELARSLIEADQSASVYLLANHGVVAVGANVHDALHRLERAEFLAKVECLASVLGGGQALTAEQMRELK
jgi:L-fuculose-phosphate aldolase